MSGLTRYPVFDWILKDDRAAIEARAELSGGTLVEVYKAAEVEAVVKPLLLDLLDRLECFDEYGKVLPIDTAIRDEATRLLARLEKP